ncbi:MAG: phosphatase PAP2 family protein [Candidatus Krumholzibacteria bacterium]|nr:phosphatase PAP2 family protein [Candidatus Krumholzibacteria bacterium]
MNNRLLLLLVLILLAASISPVSPKSVDRHVGKSSLDVKTFRYLNGSLANPVFDAIMPIVTDFRKWRVALIIVWSLLVLFGGSKGRWTALMLIPLVAASDQISSHLIKPLVGRMRPCEILGSVHLWYGPEGWIVTPEFVIGGYKTSFSFPSSHAANITASMLFLGFAFRRWLIPVMFIAAVVSFSRIYIGVHWPSDVAAGILIGSLLAWPAYIIFKRIKEPSPGKRPSG